jgi:aryl-alcohol dehydrogenase-like predicted oxidoreductase
VLHQPLNIFAVTGARTPAECAENVAAMDIELSLQEIAWLEGA